MAHSKWWMGIGLLVAVLLVPLSAGAQGGVEGGLVPVQQPCDPNTDPECNLPPDSGGGIPNCDPNTDPECNLPPGSGGESPRPDPQSGALSDRDGDGVYDPDDSCPDTFGLKPDGCPLGNDNPNSIYVKPDLSGPDVVGVISLFDGGVALVRRCLDITEVLWTGTDFSSTHQYIELHNFCDQAVDLTGVYVQLRDKQVIPELLFNIQLRGLVDPMGYYLIVNHNQTVSNIRPDLVAEFALAASNMAVVLNDLTGNVFSTANFPPNPPDEAWFAGERLRDGKTLSMERDDRFASNPDAPESWHSNDLIYRVGLDALGEPINGTPRHPNSPAPEDDDA